jgi:hypothetical protein
VSVRCGRWKRKKERRTEVLHEFPTTSFVLCCRGAVDGAKEEGGKGYHQEHEDPWHGTAAHDGVLMVFFCCSKASRNGGEGFNGKSQRCMEVFRFGN